MLRKTLALFALALAAPLAQADEGMWLSNAFPVARVHTRYRFTPSPQFLEHLRLASLKMGASASFVSRDGLVFTNHHVGAGCVHNLSTPQHDYIKEGFYAATKEQEQRCPGIEVQNLLDIQDVTSAIQQAAKPGLSDAEAGAAQRTEMSRLERECSDSSKNIRCEVVNLYSGGLYHLYRYKKYTDVRLVMAPEFDAAFFGGDPDNFTYPRYDLDITFFRVYENGRPVKVDHYLPFSTAGVKEGDLVFISGHPGSTGRLLTASQLAYLRDVSYPARLQHLKELILRLQRFSEKSPENARAAERVLFGAQNSYKAITGYNAGLVDKTTMARKQAEERHLRLSVTRNPKLKYAENAWDDIADAMDWQRENFQRITFEGDTALPGSLATIARNLVRLADELPKPSEQRLRGFQDQNIPTIEQSLFSSAPISKDLEIEQLTLALQEISQNLGADDPFTKQLLAGKSPAERAAELVKATHLDDVAFRRELYKAGKLAIDITPDPMIVLFKQIDPTLRATRKDVEDHVDSVVRRNGASISQARFQLYGTDVAPDATGTLRLSYGTVKGYVENGKRVPYYTTFAGAFEHEAAHSAKPPYRLPESWHRAKDKLRLDTVLDTVNTGDSIGGNSGSPVVNTRGEIVGILFDGNMQSLPWNFQYEDAVGRSVITDTRGIVEALRNIYDAQPLVKELLQGNTNQK